MKKQIKTKLSRILCTALALCMIIALVPAAFAETVEEATFTIDFHAFAQNNHQADVTKFTTDDITGALWWYDSKSVSGAVEFHRNYGFAIKSANDGTDLDKYVAFKFKAPASGTFDIEYKHARVASGGPSGGVGDVYILDSDVDDIATAITGTTGLMFNDVAYYAETTNYTYPETEKPEITLTAGEYYYLVFVVEDAAEGVTSAMYRQYPGTLTFTDARWNDVKAVYSFSTNGKDTENGYDSSLVTYPDMISYENSGGRVQFDSVKSSETGNLVSQWSGNYACFDLNKPGEYATYRIRIPKEGFYNLKLDYYIVANSTVANVYLFPVTQGLTEGMDSNTPVISELDFAAGITKNYGSKAGETAFYAEKAGEYYLVFECTKTQGSGFVRPGKLTLNGSKDSSATVGAPVAGINIAKTLFEENDPAETFTFTANDSATGEVIQKPQIEDLKSTDISVIDIDTTNNNQVIVKGPGVATIIADVNGYPASVTLTVNDPEMTEAFRDVKADKGYADIGDKTVKILKYSTDGVVNEYATDVTVKYNGTATVKPEDIGTPEGYTFLYWAKGVTNEKQIIPGETVSIYPTVGKTYLIAVYEPISGTTGNKVEFYNYNGQLLTDVKIDDGKMPELPSMTGYGKADHWVHYGTDNIYAAEADASAFVTGTHIFVAQYAPLGENIEVTVKNGSGEGTYKFGDTVKCIATGDGDKVFKWWTKTVNGKEEVVSLDQTYTFKAWETCTVTAVYGDKAPTYVGDTMRIIIGSLDVGGISDKAVMAEFVGLDRAVEKGIMLGTQKIAMSSNDNQFTVINDIENISETDIKGYAILANGTLITDN